MSDNHTDPTRCNECGADRFRITEAGHFVCAECAAKKEHAPIPAPLSFEERETAASTEVVPILQKYGLVLGIRMQPIIEYQNANES